MYLKCFPVSNASHSSSTFISSTTEIASKTTSVSAIRIIIFLQQEEILVCRPLRGCIHSYGSGLFLWMMRPRCHRKWRRVFCEKLEFFQFLWKESKTGHSCSRRSSSSSRWKVMVPKVTPYDSDLGPVCFLSRPSSCLRDKRPKQYPTVQHSEVVQKCKARRRCCCSPGKCLMSWGEHLSNKCTVKDNHICFR